MLRSYAEIDKLRERHQDTLLVSWSIHDINNGKAKFSAFFRREGSPKGNGAKALKEVVALADKLGLELELFAQFRGNNPQKLVKYYMQFGFRRTGDNYGIFPVMRRVVSGSTSASMSSIWQHARLKEITAL